MSEPSTTPLADSRVRALLGLVNGIIIASVGILYVDPPLTWLIVGLGLVDMVAFPYILGRVMATDTEKETAEWRN